MSLHHHSKAPADPRLDARMEKLAKRDRHVEHIFRRILHVIERIIAVITLIVLLVCLGLEMY